MSLRFVVQEHHASRLHYDFRLEHDGVLASWAVPKGPSMDPADRRLAIRVEDHELDYGGYEGIIPEGECGAGAVVIWDSGTYELLSWEEREIRFELRGRTLKGGFALVRFKGDKGNEWLLVKKKDDHAEPGWKLERALTDEKQLSLKVLDASQSGNADDG
ncbi:MAG: DNA polymerase ligase N-terminal domain-containing protein [Candidatus Eisenbacteria bacterium]